jgi:hypothetical protein
LNPHLDVRAIPVAYASKTNVLPASIRCVAESPRAAHWAAAFVPASTKWNKILTVHKPLSSASKAANLVLHARSFLHHLMMMA